MYSMRDIPFALFALLCSFGLITAVPTWEGMNGRQSIGILIPGASYIEAHGPGAYGDTANHLAVPWIYQGNVGNLTITPNSRNAPLFYINQNQLWLLVNETAVYPVNVLNTTLTHALPMQLTVGRKREGITTGKWNWQGTMLQYDLPGKASNERIFFNCANEGGWNNNVFMSHIPVPPPDGCSMMTLHSFSSVRLNSQK